MSIRKKIFQGSLVILLAIALSFFLLRRFSVHIFFMSDNLIKLVQANSLLENHFESESVRCVKSPIEDGCRFIMDGFFTVRDKRIGPFPIANSIVSAAMLTIGGPIAIVYLTIILLAATLILLLFYSDVRPSTLLGFLCLTPILFHYLDFPDVALSGFLIVAGVSFLLGPDSVGLKIASGFCAALAGFFRPEVYIIFIILSITLVFFQWRSGRSIRQTARQILPALIVFGTGIFLFFTMNLILYGTMTGPRIATNQGGILNISLLEKLENAKSLLFFGNNRYGYFGYTPALLGILAYTFIYWKKLSPQTAALLWSTAISIFIITALSPNDSNIDWGSRYFSGLFAQFVLLTDRCRREIPPGRKSIIVLAFLALFSVANARLYFKVHNEIAMKLNQTLTFYRQTGSQIWIFSNNAFINYTGTEIIQRPIYLVRDADASRQMVSAIKKCAECISVSLIFPDESLSALGGNGQINPYSLDPELRKAIFQEFLKIDPKPVKNETEWIQSFTFRLH